MTPSITIRALSVAQAETMVDWAAAEGWNPGLADARAFHAADPDGFLGAFRDGELVATISAVAYGEELGFVGFYLVRPDLRGQGIGSRLWQAGLERLDRQAGIGLDGVVEQQANYARKGFRPIFRSVRHAGVVRGTPSVDKHVVGFAERHRVGIAALDTHCFGLPRPAFLRSWLAPPHRVLVHEEGGDLGGFLVLRRCREGFKIGPLSARTPEVARRLFDAALGQAWDEQLVIDIPEPNGHAVSMAREAGLLPVFETMRMVRGQAPDLPLGAVYGIASFELG